jgi:nitrate reductase molybdenum cofactor assembly chaperone NarJ/NarW
MLVLRALGALVSYPRAEIREALPEIAQVVSDTALLSEADRKGILSLIATLRALDPMEAEERYVELFDHSRATSLHLFEHLHGEARDRGQGMVELKRIYEQGGFDVSPRELPDYLPVLLEYLSCRDLPEARDMLSDCADILRGIGEALARRGSPYVAIFQALLSIAGAAPVDVPAASRQKPKPKDLDREWAEQPAFAERAGPGGISAYAPDGRVR